MRIMGLDYGSKTVGVAVSDSLLITAQAKETITRNKKNALKKTFARIAALISEFEVGLIVVGLPLNMDGSEGEMAAEARKFAETLKNKTGLDVVMRDERLTTYEALDTLKEMGIKPEDMKKYADKIAAAFILRDYLNSERN